jgi:DNA-binding GntR family transcriptional regulator
MIEILLMSVPSSPSIITPRSLDMQAADVLREQILSGTFAPGTRLLEIDLAAQFQLSRGTIRSALQQLTHEGLVVQYPYRGCAVCSLSAQDIWELYTLRQALEGLAARLAADRLTVSYRNQLQTQLQQLVEAAQQSSWRAVAEADFALHQTIIDASGHRRLQAQYNIVAQQIRLYIMACNALRPNLDGIITDHQNLVAALISGDAAQAEQIARDHHTDGPVLAEHLKTIETNQGEQNAEF